MFEEKELNTSQGAECLKRPPRSDTGVPGKGVSQLVQPAGPWQEARAAHMSVAQEGLAFPILLCIREAFTSGWVVGIQGQ